MQILSACGHPKTFQSHNFSELSKPSRRRLPSFPQRMHNHQPKLHSKIEMMLRNVIASKGFLSKLPDALCNSDRFPLEGCWNGTAMGLWVLSMSQLLSSGYLCMYSLHGVLLPSWWRPVSVMESGYLIRTKLFFVLALIVCTFLRIWSAMQRSDWKVNVPLDDISCISEDNTTAAIINSKEQCNRSQVKG